MSHFVRLLKTFDYHSLTEFAHSLVPSIKYSFVYQLSMISVSWVVIDKIFGLDAAGFIALLIIFPTELISGIWASMVKREPFSSVKLSRFSLKVACYLVMIGVSYSLYSSFTKHNKDAAAWAFGWLHIVLVTQVGFENTISILENIAIINGKEKGTIVTRITEKFNSLFNPE